MTPSLDSIPLLRYRFRYPVAQWRAYLNLSNASECRITYIFPWFRNSYSYVKKLRRLLMPSEDRKIKKKRLAKKTRKKRWWYKTGKEKWWYSDEGSMETREERYDRTLGNRQWPPSFKTSLAKCLCGGLWVVARRDGVRRSHTEPRRHDADRCFGLREQPLSLVVASAAHVGRFFLRSWWWHCSCVVCLFGFVVCWLVGSFKVVLGLWRWYKCSDLSCIHRDPLG